MPPLHARTNVGIFEERTEGKRGMNRLLASSICLLLLLISTCSGWNMRREHNKIDMQQPSKRVGTQTVCESSVQFKGAEVRTERIIINNMVTLQLDKHYVCTSLKVVDRWTFVSCTTLKIFLYLIAQFSLCEDTTGQLRESQFSLLVFATLRSRSRFQQLRTGSTCHQRIQIKCGLGGPRISAEQNSLILNT